MVGAAWLFSPLWHSADALKYLSDDFFYYAKIAANIAAGRGSTFDGITATNGYHPLYELLLVIAAKFGSGIRPMLTELYMLGIAATTATFVFVRRLFRFSGIEAVLANALAVFPLWSPVRMFYQSMEVTLTIPLALALVWYFVARFEAAKVHVLQSIAFGSIAAAMILSRLDSAFLVTCLVIVGMCHREVRSRLSPPSVAAFCLACGLPLIVYVGMNHVLFHAWLPVSGMAKQMRSTHWPSRMALHSAWAGNAEWLVCINVAAIALWLATFRRLKPAWQAVTLATLIFPFIQIGAFAVLSDWQMWGWYHYVYAPVIVVFLLLAVVGFGQWLPRPNLTTAALLVVACVLLVHDRWNASTEMVQIADSARVGQQFASTHPAVYGMGDRAGMVGWLSTQPVFQAEGLVEDRAWLETIKLQGDLATALRSRGVRYYIATKWLVDGPEKGLRPGCFAASEPLQAGPTAPHLTSVLCDPVIDYPELHEPGIIDKRLLVFDLEHQPTRDK
jgi:hypothetical protein